MILPIRYRFPFLFLANIILLIGIWSGLQRLGWGLPFRNLKLSMQHGSLMISGFLGTLISLERAVALKNVWGYAAPALIGIGSLLLIILPQPDFLPHFLILGGGVVFVIISMVVIKKFSIFPSYVIGVGVILWVIGNILWSAGLTVENLLGFWEGFLIFVIAGERLELSRVLKITKQARVIFVMVLMFIIVGIVLSTFNLIWGNRIIGIGMISLSMWLFRNDLASKNLRHSGLNRFIAASLLAGYFWLGVCGILNVFYGGAGGGVYYDMMVHSLFLGFVFSMIFGHAPLIFPAILGVPIRFYPIFYIHLILLHLSLIVRIMGDSTFWISGRYWGGMLNGVAIVVFLFSTVFSVLLSKNTKIKT